MPSQSLDRMPVEEMDFKRALRHFASGVTIITTIDDHGLPHGMTATAFSSLSLRPPLILVAVARKTRCHAQIVARGRFGVSILHEDQAAMSRHFGGQADRQDVSPPFGMLDETPVVAAAMVRLACRLDEAIEGGDHTIFIGLVTAAMTAPGQPLLHFDGTYRRLAEADDVSS